ncbi:AAA family ATPase [Winogradskyella sp.]|uniref:AAA family ATPase n=1 Tax=Winogradskyella sp. TaxID=1883156 RepID=UPI003AB8D46A
MINYRDYEKQVYNWLMQKHDANKDFTFSVRQNASKGTELDYFIGTEKSNYFATTFWTLPVSYPGSSADCISLIFTSKGDNYNYKFEFSQVNAPHDDQNQSVLNIVEASEGSIEELFGLKKKGTYDKKIFYFVTKQRSENYTDLTTMLLDIEKDLELIIPIVNKAIVEEKKNNLEVTAHLITLEEFNAMQDKLSRRFEKYKHQTLESAKESPKYWLYASGRNAEHWDGFYDEGIMAIGWDKLGDLSQYDSKEDVFDALKENYGGEGDKKNNVAANYDFLYNMAIGDVVIVKRGRGELLGYGVITSEYFFDTSRVGYKSCRKVDWKLKGNWQTPFSLVLKTLTDVTQYESKSAQYEFYYENLMGIMKGDIDTTNLDVSNSIPVNQIFYGPPGTGKTYNTILEAAKIITQQDDLSYNEAQAVFNENLGGQIEFITFHQNYSYEDFIQGLKPDVEAGGELSFYKSDGVFKKITDRALKNYKESNTKVQKKRDFSDVFEEFIFPLVEGEVEEIEIKMRKVSFFITNVKDKSIEFRKTSGGTDHTLSIGTLEEMYDEESIKGIKGLASYYRPLLEELLQSGKLNETEHIIRKNYVIIIDEINRANISRVFGELITLIEKDKRYGGKIPLTATLPSGDRFIVPSNLYIIGTMNTADKSIALLDIALRRRFEFVPMYPNSESTEDKVVHDGDILEAINKEIISRKGYDFTIGHSYFMGDDYDLKHTIDNKVIPLLLEYFMNDFDEVKKLLSAASLIVDGWPMTLSLHD